jgi:hypothetical protein
VWLYGCTKLTLLLLLLLQALDNGINSWWESRNQGKLFKHMTIPPAEE